MAIDARSWCLALGLILASQATAVAAESQLTLQEAIARAIASNPDFAADRLDRDMALFELRRASDRYGLALGLDTVLSQNTSPASAVSSTFGNTPYNASKANVDVSLKQSLSTNGVLGLTFNNGYRNSNLMTDGGAPAFSPTVGLGLSQPLLRDAWTGSALIKQADISLQRARLTLRDKLMRLVADTASAYWDLVSEREAYAVLERSLTASRTLLEANKAKEAAGFLSKMDVVQAQASVAATETDLLDAKRRVLNAEDRLRRLVLAADDSAGWQGDLVPADKPAFEPTGHDFEAIRQVALKRRPDYQAALLEVEARRIDAGVARQGMLPGLNLNVNGGVSQTSDQYGRAVSALGSSQTYTVTAGVSLDLPVSRPSQRDAYDRAAIAETQAELRAKASERQLFSDLRQDFRHVEIGAKRLEAAAIAKQLAEQQLEAEIEKLNLGLSTNFQVITYQKALDDASLKANNALVEAIKAEVELKRLAGTLLDGMSLPEALR